MEAESIKIFDKKYWSDHLVRPVRFSETIEKLSRNGVDLFIEVGATSSLTMAMGQVTENKCLSLFDKKTQDLDLFMQGLCYLYEGCRLESPEKIFVGTDKSRNILNYNLQNKKKLWIDDLSYESTKDYFYGSESCIQDHVANNKAIAPAAMLIDYLLYKTDKNLSKLIIEAPFSIEAQPKYLDTSIIENEFVLSAIDSQSNLDLIKGRLRARLKSYQLININDLRQDFDTWFTPTEIYEVLAKNGLVFGPSMQSIDVVGYKDNELFVELTSKNINYHGYLIEPSLLDGAFQSLAAFGIGAKQNSDGFLGFSAGEVRFYSEVKNHCFAYIKLKSEFNEKSDIMRFDVTLFDKNGKILVELDDFTAKRVTNKLNTFKTSWEVVELKESMVDYEIVNLNNFVNASFSSDVIVLERPTLAELFQFCQYATTHIKHHKIVLITDKNYIISFFRSFAAENTGIFCKAILTSHTIEEVYPYLTNLSNQFLIKIENNIGHIPTLKEYNLNNNSKLSKEIVVIFGGEGGIGCTVKDKLKSQGHTVITIGRSYKNIENYFQCDITNAFEVMQTIEKISKLGNISYVIHSAGILSDSLVKNLDEDTIMKVTGPKINGTQNIVEACVNIKTLKSLVLVSSLSSIVASTGQAHYSAANAYLNDMAQRKFNFTIKSLLFGPWKDVGMVADISYQKSFEVMGLHGIDPELGANLIIETLSAEFSGELVAINFAQNKKMSLLKSINENSYKYENVKINTSTLIDRPVLAQKIVDTNGDVEDFLIKIISEKLSLDKSLINPNDSFQDLGLDSIGGVSLVKEIENRYNLKLYPTVFFEYRNTSLLANYLKREFSL
jgi:acyl carrier protein